MLPTELTRLAFIYAAQTSVQIKTSIALCSEMIEKNKIDKVRKYGIAIKCKMSVKYDKDYSKIDL